MLTGRAGWSTIHIAFHGTDARDRADALKRIAAEFGPGFAQCIADDVAAHEQIEHNRREALRVARNARSRERRANP